MKFEILGASRVDRLFYQLSIDSNYIRMDHIHKNVYWPADTEYGDLEITINLSKPEKDSNHPDVSIGIVKCPLSVMRLASWNKDDLMEMAVYILDRWREYGDVCVGIYGYSTVEGVPVDTMDAGMDQHLVWVEMLFPACLTSFAVLQLCYKA